MNKFTIEALKEMYLFSFLILFIYFSLVIFFFLIYKDIGCKFICSTLPRIVEFDEMWARMREQLEARVLSKR